MKSLFHRYRSKKGLTDYHHRLKMLKDYETIVRIYLMKKNKYYIAGVYSTPYIDKPDKCHLYCESRWLKLKDRKLSNNQLDLKHFGAFVGTKLNALKLDLDAKKLIIDIGRRKKIQITNFLIGLKATLNLQYSEKLKVRAVESIQVEVPTV